MSLAPIEQKSLPEVVEDRLLDYIRDERLTVGSALPGEMELAERFQVSRGVVREAISRLRILGIIESRRNRGIILCRPDPLSGFDKALSSPLLGRQNECDLMQLRVIHELGILDLFWDRKTPSDVADLKTLAAQVDRHPDYPTVTRRNRQLEIAFHGRIFQVAGNRLVTRMRGLLSQFYALEELHRQTPPFKRPDLPTHGRLVSIMAGGTRSQFRDAMYEHLRVYLDLLERAREREVPEDDD